MDSTNLMKMPSQTQSPSLSVNIKIGLLMHKTTTLAASFRSLVWERNANGQLEALNSSEWALDLIS